MTNWCEQSEHVSEIKVFYTGVAGLKMAKAKKNVMVWIQNLLIRYSKIKLFLLQLISRVPLFLVFRGSTTINDWDHTSNLISCEHVSFIVLYVWICTLISCSTVRLRIIWTTTLPLVFPKFSSPLVHTYGFVSNWICAVRGPEWSSLSSFRKERILPQKSEKLDHEKGQTLKYFTTM